MSFCKKPLVSIVLPVHNGEAYLEKALESVMNQTFTDFELVLVDDCSTDHSAEIMDNAAEKDERVRVIHNCENKKLPGALNTGFKICSGEYLTWTSDDNILHERALEVMLDTIRKTDADIVWCDYYMIDSSGRIFAKRDFSQYKAEDLLYVDIVGACFLYKKQVHEQLHGFREDMFLVEDYDFWLRAYKHGFSFRHIPQVLYQYRVHGKSLTGKRFREVRLKDISLRKRNLFVKSGVKMKGRICRNISEAYRINQMWGRAVLYYLAAYLCGIRGWL